jgi:hypothetical protein
MAGESGGFHGASASIWAAVAVVIAGSIVMGVALIEWVWPVFWVGAGLVVAGCVWAAAAGVMDSVSEFTVISSPEITSE